MSSNQNRFGNYFGFLAGIIAFSCVQLPYPYSDIGMWLLVAAFILLIFIGHKAAFRAHPRGILAQLTEPSKIWGAKFNSVEKQIMYGSIIVVVSVIGSFVLKVTLFTK